MTKLERIQDQVLYNHLNSTKSLLMVIKDLVLNTFSLLGMTKLERGLSKEEVRHHVLLAVFIQILKRALLWRKLWIGQHGKNIELKQLWKQQEDIDNKEKLILFKMAILYFSNSIRQMLQKQ